jgi:aryl-alcohol dehydrogenase-like predicted oxidoreductase
MVRERPAPGARRQFGSTGVEIAALALGAMNFGIATPPDEAAVMLARAMDAGITLIDTADVYGESEQVVGDVLARTGRRDDVLLATKVGLPRGDGSPDTWHRREHIVASCDRSLRNLRTDHVDLYQLHRPSQEVPIEETLGVLGELVDAGKVRWIGTSTFAAWMVADARALAGERGLPAVASEQPPYNLLDRRAENELIPMCEHYDVAVIPWSPLAGGVLAGRYDRVDQIPDDSRAARVPMTRERMNERALGVAAALGDLARERGLTTSQLALLWAKDQPGVTAPIIGPRTTAQLDDALAVLDLVLDDDARAACDALVHPGNAVSDFHSTAFWMKASVQ